MGIPLTFVIVLLLSLAGAGWPNAAGIAICPALFGGPFIGGFVVLMKRMSELGSAARVTHLPVAPSATTAEHREAA